MQSLRRCFLTALVVACSAPLAAQSVEMRFESHGYSFNTLTGGMGASSPNARIPFSLSYRDGTRSGTIEMVYPETLTGVVQGGYLVLSSPATVGFRLEMDHVADATTPPQDVESRMNLEISSEHSSGENSPCKLQGSFERYPSGTTKRFSRNFTCTFSRIRASGNTATVNNYVELRTVSNACGTFPCPFDIFVGATYRAAAPVDLTVGRIEVVQATQDAAQTIPLVAQKSTVARVFVGLGGATQTVANVRAILRGYNAASVELPGSPLRASNEPIRAALAPNRENTDDSLNFKLPATWTASGAITLRAEVNPEGTVSEPDRVNNVRDLVVFFQERKRFDVRYLPICIQTEANCPSNAVGSYDAKMRKLFPAADDRLTYSRLKGPTWVWTFPLATGEDQSFLLAALRLRYELANDTSIDQIAAWLPDVRTGSPNAAGGLADPLWYQETASGRVSFTQDLTGVDAPGTVPGEGWTGATLPHEIGHNLGLRHTNTPDCNGCRDPDTDWPHPASGRVQEVGFDPQAMSVMPAAKFDLMTYQSVPGSNIWISPFHFQKLFNGQFRPQGLTPLSPAAEAPYAIVTGSARRDGTAGRLDPVFVISSSVPPSPPAPGGNHCIRFSGATGTLSEPCFNLSFHLHPGEQHLDEEYFALRFPYPDGVTRVTLTSGGRELATRSASANAPTVTITSPRAGDTWDGRRKIVWTASDPDGDPLTYTVLASSDGGTTWLPLETGTASTEFSFDTAEIGSGSGVLFRVIGSDGFRSGEATAGPLTIAAAPVIGLQREADLGSVALGAFSETTLLITNSGDRALTVGAVRTSLADFAVRETFPIVIGAGGRRSVALRFTPAVEGVRSSTLSFESDDPARPVVTAQAFGAGVAAPQIAITPSSLVFGEVATGSSRDLTLRVRNTGRGTLRVLALGSSSSQFGVQQPAVPFSIAEGAEVSVTVNFRPAAPGAQTAALSVGSTAGGATLASVPLSGIGTGSGAACSLAISPASAALPAAGGSGAVTIAAPAGCAWSAGSGADWLTIGATSGTGGGSVSYSAGPNSGPARSAAVALGATHLVVFQAGGAEFFLVPAVASTPGALGSFFKTGVQLHNPTSAPVSGQLTYHAGGISGSSEDPALHYDLAPGETVTFPDLLPAFQQSGLGSADLVPRTGGAPVATFRVFNDAGEAGTTGMTEELMRPGEALEAGKKGVLIAPPEPSRARFNIGVRSLSFGATIRFTVRDSTGVVRTSGAKFYPASFFQQQTAEGFLGIAPLANDTVTFEVDAGSAVVYGATTDNTTQDPSLQFARALSSRADPARTIAAVAAATGVLDSLFRTTLQLHNPTGGAISGRLVFHPAGLSGSESDPSVTYVLAPGATVSYPDVLAAFQRTGLGSLDLIATSGAVPLAVARVFNDGGARGTTGFSIDALRPEEALQSGQTGVLIAPADPGATRFNVGVRTFSTGAAMTVTIRNASGQPIRSLTKFYAPNYFEQQPGTAFLGAVPGPSESIAVRIDAGSAIVYGASTDNKTQDPAMQVARSLAP